MDESDHVHHAPSDRALRAARRAARASHSDLLVGQHASSAATHLSNRHTIVSDDQLRGSEPEPRHIQTRGALASESHISELAVGLESPNSSLTSLSTSSEVANPEMASHRDCDAVAVVGDIVQGLIMIEGQPDQAPSPHQDSDLTQSQTIPQELRNAVRELEHAYVDYTGQGRDVASTEESTHNDGSVLEPLPSAANPPEGREEDLGRSGSLPPFRPPRGDLARTHRVHLRTPSHPYPTLPHPADPLVQHELGINAQGQQQIPTCVAAGQESGHGCGRGAASEGARAGHHQGTQSRLGGDVLASEVQVHSRSITPPSVIEPNGHSTLPQPVLDYLNDRFQDQSSLLAALFGVPVPYDSAYREVLRIKLVRGVLDALGISTQRGGPRSSTVQAQDGEVLTIEVDHVLAWARFQCPSTYRNKRSQVVAIFALQHWLHGRVHGLDSSAQWLLDILTALCSRAQLPTKQDAHNREGSTEAVPGEVLAAVTMSGRTLDARLREFREEKGICSRDLTNFTTLL
ncbi:hypothetical protein OH77DRAFT_1594035 [Trametes cingulata]|nr:hypothetical protein OH77DRAFT_1594035 [Trametes cingulata]